jgi:uncharacterized protein
MRYLLLSMVLLLSACEPTITTTTVLPPPEPVQPAAPPSGVTTPLPVLDPVTVKPLVDAEGLPVETIGMADPASVNCGKQGGKLEFRTTSAGQITFCHLPDGRVVEEWALYRETNPG